MSRAVCIALLPGGERLGGLREVGLPVMWTVSLSVMYKSCEWQYIHPCGLGQ